MRRSDKGTGAVQRATHNGRQPAASAPSEAPAVPGQGSVRTQASRTTASPTASRVRHAALTFSIKFRQQDMNTSRRADDDAMVLSILK